ncbi:hypothetical protein [Gordonia tangerina]|uniref:Helix-turn-helix domain-containing protein n=1 Tax=Gordonia tangerina TaxID=2911060 RepID=A0ABS9DNX5_9ACTN|nr:hypothetical protein [Gordonia tangerina]MCF3939930.1 hypothetical protein [Gordonia tangerina]
MSIWRNKEFVARSVEAQRCYMMLLAQKDINNAGVQPLMIRKWARACADTTEDDIVRALDELQAHRFLCYDTDTEELFIRTFIRNDGIIKQPNVMKNALRVAEQTESPILRKALAAELDSLRRSDASEAASRILPDNAETLPEPFNPSGTPLEPCGDGDGEGVTKRSEVTSTSTPVVPRNRGTRLHEEWMPEKSVIDEMRGECPNIDLEAEHRKFVDYWMSKSGKDATKVDWNRTWRNWIRNARPRPQSRAAPQSTTDARIAAAQALKDPDDNVHQLQLRGHA